MLRHPALVPLSRQHHGGLMLCVLTERASGRDSGADARRIVEAFDGELRNHFDLEEELLFPLTSPAMAARVGAEHSELTSLVDQLRAAADPQVVQRFVELLRAHIRFEENDWFEELQRAVPPETLAPIGKQLAARAVRACATGITPPEA